ncbi:FG-GAP repeat domain-containing protein [Streptomyces sp. NPDC059491]|uniref:FG-GAP repeat domain-containing protein n=1 Tax=Streptomyces sp. NPDC059491 TaxID=3346850 RepID=UPI00368712B9
MIRVHTPQRLLVTAVTAVLAVTAAGMTTPAAAAPSTTAFTAAALAVTAGEQDAAPALPAGSHLAAGGPSGVLTSVATETGTEYRWTRYSTGVTTVLPPGPYLGSVGTDLAVTSAEGVHTLYDLGTGADPVVVDTTALGPNADLQRLAGSTLVMARPNAVGGTEVHLVDKPEDTVVDRTVTGLPANAWVYRYEVSTPDTLLLAYNTAGAPGKHLAVVDVATGAVTDTRPLPFVANEGDATATARLVAWTEPAADGSVTLAVAPRGDTSVTRTPLGTGNVQVELLGDQWVTYGVGSYRQTAPNPLHGLTARSLTTGRTVKLLDSMERVVGDAHGGLLVRGGTAAHGEGVYRVSVDAAGAPTATLVATTGEPTAIGAVTRQTPGTVDFGTGGNARWSWEFDRGNVELRLQLTHTATGRRWTSEPQHLDRAHVLGVEWTGMTDHRTSAPNGAYTWRMTARPTDGIGPVLERTGALTVANRPAPHDFSDSGAPDLLVRDGSGRLLGYDARQTLYETGRWGTPSQRERVDHGPGWNAYDRLTVPGDAGGSAHADVLGRDRTGVLWLHQGTGKGFSPRTRIGGGWQIYDQLAAGSDVTGDNRPDLVATDKAGVMWLYKGTGSSSTPYANRVRVGAGWTIYDRVTATGNIAGAPAGDLLARDRAGVLWMYLGKGDGTFATRIRVGAGWNRYSDIVGVGDTNRDGRPDLVVQGVAGGTHETLAHYLGTGDWRAPFGSRQGVYNPEPLGTGDVTLF